MKVFVRPTVYEYDTVWEEKIIEWSNGYKETIKHLVGSKIKNDSYETEINSLEEIIDILNSQEHPIIISIPKSDVYDLEIEIYNDYRE